MHPIDAASPLHGLSEAQWKDVQIYANLTGIDGIYGRGELTANRQQLSIGRRAVKRLRLRVM
jgi:hypothetical protein